MTAGWVWPDPVAGTAPEGAGSPWLTDPDFTVPPAHPDTPGPVDGTEVP